MALGLKRSRRAGAGNAMIRGCAYTRHLGAAMLVALALCMPSSLVHGLEGLEANRPALANRLDEIGPLLSRCLRMPDYDVARPGMHITVRPPFTPHSPLLAPP